MLRSFDDVIDAFCAFGALQRFISKFEREILWKYIMIFRR